MDPTPLIKARYVRFQYGNAYGGGRCMNLGGVRVYTSPTSDNIVSPAMATTVLDELGAGYVPGNMVDNNDSTMYHSSCGSEYPWVKIDLGSEEFIYRVELTNRADCCRSRIAGITLQLWDSNDNVIYTSDLIPLSDGSTIYREGMDGYLHYTFWPSINTTPYPSSSLPYPTVPTAPTPAITGPIRMGDFRNFHAKGIPGVPAFDFSMSKLRNKTKSMLHGLPVRIFYRRYTFSAGAGGLAAASGVHPGGGGAGGVLVYDGGSLLTPTSGATAGGGESNNGGGRGGTGFGAGGGGGGSLELIPDNTVTYQNFTGNEAIVNRYGWTTNEIVNWTAPVNLTITGLTIQASGAINNYGLAKLQVFINNVNVLDVWYQSYTFQNNVIDVSGWSTKTLLAGQTLAVRWYMLEGWRYFQTRDITNLPIIVNYIPTGVTNNGPTPEVAGTGINGFAYIKVGSTEYFTQTTSSYTFTASGTARILLMGGGGGGGNKVGSSNRGGGGGGGGYLQTYNVTVTRGSIATITIGGGGSGTNSLDGGTTSIVISGTTYSASGGQNGGANQNGGAGSSSGGAGAYQTGQTNGGSGGTAGANTTSQGVTAFNTNTMSGSGEYFADDPNWFDARTEMNTPTLVTNFTNINTATGGLIPSNGSTDQYSVEWFGYFSSLAAGSYTFYTESNDASYVWIGATAQSGYTTANALVNNGGIHTVQERSGTITLAADTLYPIRIQFGDNTSTDQFALSFSGPGIARTYNLAGHVFFGMGVYSNAPTISARMLRAITNTNNDGAYYVMSGASSAPIYCLMNKKWDGGGWMMLMKATRGTTFQYYSTYWTDANTTLNTNDLTRSNADAKYSVFNTANIKDVMALWPDVGRTGGSIPQSETWSWLVNDYYGGGARTTAITGFSTGSARDSPSFPDPLTFPGFSSSIWSYQSPARRFVIGGINHIVNTWFQVRWGFIWNENGANDYSSPDAFGGIGMTGGWGGGGANNTYSAGDFYGCCGSLGLNRTMRFEMFGR